MSPFGSIHSFKCSSTNVHSIFLDATFALASQSSLIQSHLRCRRTAPSTSHSAEHTLESQHDHSAYRPLAFDRYALTLWRDAAHEKLDMHFAYLVDASQTAFEKDTARLHEDLNAIKRAIERRLLDAIAERRKRLEEEKDMDVSHESLQYDNNNRAHATRKSRQNDPLDQTTNASNAAAGKDSGATNNAITLDLLPPSFAEQSIAAAKAFGFGVLSQTTAHTNTTRGGPRRRGGAASAAASAAMAAAALDPSSMLNNTKSAAADESNQPTTATSVLSNLGLNVYQAQTTTATNSINPSISAFAGLGKSLMSITSTTDLEREADLSAIWKGQQKGRRR